MVFHTIMREATFDIVVRVQVKSSQYSSDINILFSLFQLSEYAIHVAWLSSVYELVIVQEALWDISTFQASGVIV